MKTERDITEAKIVKQADEIFCNTLPALVTKLDEEHKEIMFEFLCKRLDYEKLFDEIGDVCYVLCQIMDRVGTNYNESLQRAFAKNEKKRL